MSKKFSGGRRTIFLIIISHERYPIGLKCGVYQRIVFEFEIRLYVGVTLSIAL